MHNHSEEHPHEQAENDIRFASSGTPLIIVGTDVDARMALDIANSLEAVVYGLMTDKEEEVGTEVNDVAVVMRIDSPEGKKLIDGEKAAVMVAERDTERRKSLARKVLTRKAEVINLVYPDIVFSPYSKMGVGNLIGSGVAVMANSQIGNFCSVQAGVFIDAEVLVGDFCTLQAGAKISRGVKLEAEVFVGMGAIIGPGITIGKGALIAPGAVVIQSVEAGARAIGNPAKIIRED